MKAELIVEDPSWGGLDLMLLCPHLHAIQWYSHSYKDVKHTSYLRLSSDQDRYGRDLFAYLLLHGVQVEK